METRRSREEREVGRAITTGATGGLLVKTASYSMVTRDFVIHAAPAAAVTITLPPVAEARGKFYTIKATGHAYATTVVDKSDDSRYWLGDITLIRTGQSVVLFSDGEEWHVVYASPGVVGVDLKRIFEDWRLPFVVSATTINDGSIVAGSAGDEMTMLCQSGHVFELHYLGGGQTLMGPIWTSPGINVALDLTDDDGVEITHGIQTDAPALFTIGTDPAFFFSAKFTIADVSGTDDCAVGFRKQAAYQANIDDYSDWSVLNVISGNITGEQELNAGTADSDDTVDNWGDGETKTLRVNVSAAGVVTFLIDGSDPTTVPTSFTFDDADVVMPFFYFLHATTTPGALTLLEWEVGYQ